MSKYLVSEKNYKGEISLREFDGLSQAYKFYLENPARRTIMKEVNVKVVEGGE